jgi:hypothetical protein
MPRKDTIYFMGANSATKVQDFRLKEKNKWKFRALQKVSPPPPNIYEYEASFVGLEGP